MAEQLGQTMKLFLLVQVVDAAGGTGELAPVRDELRCRHHRDKWGAAHLFLTYKQEALWTSQEIYFQP